MVENEFSWSKARDSIFKDCKRKYYLNYYGSWGGWKRDSTARGIYILKKLVTRQVWIGQVVHYIIETLLSNYKTGKKISLSELLFELKKKLKEEFDSSKIKEYHQFPGYKTGLFEHEYNLLISKEEWEDLFKIAEKCVRNFYNSDVFKYIKNVDPEKWVFLEDFLNFDFEGTKVYLKIDFAIKNGNKIILFDWKTGQERQTEDIELQLSCYALYVLQKWGLTPDNISVKICNLRLDKEDSFSITNETIDNIKNYIRNSLSEMKSLLDGQEDNSANMENFPKTENEMFCSCCNFKKLCFNQGESVFLTNI